ncbi:MAG TPA: LytTR family DNA-binding domain-containing protein [Chitinophagaceae bacterium]|jgi:DNA-binding LytR/AlgR family response regulator|nr:LytTR family DNA-binding domain-containing protein [Chitinophagaceae bacterium]
MITCLLIDDEPYAVGLLEHYIARVPYLEVKHKCHTALEALAFLQTDKADLIFLDINMPQLSGMQLATLLPPGQLFVFTTAYAEHAVESYEKAAVDYLLKPILFDRFLKAVARAEAQLQQQRVGPSTEPETLYLKSGRALIPVQYTEVFYIEGMKDYVVFHTSTGRHIVHKRMKELEESLPAHFSRIHLSYIINRSHIRRIEDNQVLLEQHRLPIGEKYREAFLREVERKLL